MIILVITGLIIGFSFEASVAEIVAGIGLLLLFGYAFSWIFALIGMSVSSPEAANGIGFTLIFPITFISSAFVPIDSMPAALQKFAEVNPITIVVDAMRALWLGAPAGQQHLGRCGLVPGADRDLRPAGGPEVPEDGHRLIPVAPDPDSRSDAFGPGGGGCNHPAR